MPLKSARGIVGVGVRFAVAIGEARHPPLGVVGIRERRGRQRTGPIGIGLRDGGDVLARVGQRGHPAHGIGDRGELAAGKAIGSHQPRRIGDRSQDVIGIGVGGAIAVTVVEPGKKLAVEAALGAVLIEQLVGVGIDLGDDVVILIAIGMEIGSRRARFEKHVGVAVSLDPQQIVFDSVEAVVIAIHGDQLLETLLAPTATEGVRLSGAVAEVDGNCIAKQNLRILLAGGVVAAADGKANLGDAGVLTRQIELQIEAVGLGGAVAGGI